MASLTRETEYQAKGLEGGIARWPCAREHAGKDGAQTQVKGKAADSVGSGEQSLCSASRKLPFASTQALCGQFRLQLKIMATACCALIRAAMPIEKLCFSAGSGEYRGHSTLSEDRTDFFTTEAQRTQRSFALLDELIM